MKGAILHKLRVAAGLSVDELGQITGTTGRRVAMWEAKSTIAFAREKLLMFEIVAAAAKKGHEIVLIRDQTNKVIDVIAKDLFLKLSVGAMTPFTISTISVGRGEGRPYVHKTEYNILPYNSDAHTTILEWDRKLTY